MFLKEERECKQEGFRGCFFVEIYEILIEGRVVK
jgi:hypothetical protein